MILSPPFAALVALGLLAASPCLAAGPVVITQQKALQGGISPGDEPGYPIDLAAGVSYRLGSDLRVAAGQDAFSSFAGEIDLGGFTVSGDGIARAFMQSCLNGLTVRNGTIRGFTGFAFLCVGERAFDWKIIEVTFTNNGGAISVRNGGFVGGGFQYRNLIVQNNGGGVDCGYECDVEGSIFAENTGPAIALVGGIVSNNTIISNEVGIEAFFYKNGSYVEREGIIGTRNNTIAHNTTQILDTNPPRVVSFQSNACVPGC